ncbi:unnamed protein product [Taenia asiatica]|uniref:BURP domain-containing protein n=1 Tax=Taenia asiatica TaxID=60517 RepID=A0A0R3WET1_TAEAS|nr:unnamed protein product [Taenia asiatica]
MIASFTEEANLTKAQVEVAACTKFLLPDDLQEAHEKISKVTNAGFNVAACTHRHSFCFAPLIGIVKDTSILQLPVKQILFVYEPVKNTQIESVQQNQSTTKRQLTVFSQKSGGTQPKSEEVRVHFESFLSPAIYANVSASKRRTYITVRVLSFFSI